MARPLLDLRALRTPMSSTESGWARGLSQAASGITAGLQQRAAKKEKAQQEFISAMDQDINAVSNDLFKTYAVQQYDKIRGDWTTTFKEQKGWLTPEQKIQMQSDLRKYQGEVEYLNSMSKYNDAAIQAQQKQPGLEYRSGDWMNFIKAVNSGDTEKAREAGSLFLQSDSGVPGTTLLPANPNDALVAVAPDIIKNFKKEELGAQQEMRTDKDGTRWQRTNVKYKNADPDMFRSMLGGSIANSKYGNRYEKALKQMLTPEQQKQAILTYTGDNPLVRYWAENILDDRVVNEFAGEKTDFGTWSKVSGTGPTANGSGGAGWTTVKETDIGWDFGTTPISITKTIGGESYKNAAVVGVERDKEGNYSAKLIVPKGRNEYLEVLNRAREREAAGGEGLTNEEVAYIMSESQNPDKYKNVTIPLEDIYDELKVGFKKKKVNLEGYENIVFPEPMQVTEEEAVTDTKAQEKVKIEW